MAVERWIDRAGWNLRIPELGSLRNYDDGRALVVAPFRPVDRGLEKAWRALSELWLELPPHRHVLDAVDRAEDDAVLLRYAAVNWKQPVLGLGANPTVRTILASWADQVTSAYETIADAMPEVGRFLGPRILIDLGQAARLVFLPVMPGELPADAMESWPRRNDSVIAHVIAMALRRLCTDLEHPDARTLGAVLERCTAPRSHFKTSAAR